MRQRNLFNQLKAAGTDDNFLQLVHSVEKVVSKFLAIAMLIVIAIAIFDLGILLFKELKVFSLIKTITCYIQYYILYTVLNITCISNIIFTYL